MSAGRPVRVLQSFPHKIGAARICTTAWHQADGAARAGADLMVMTGAVEKPLPDGIEVRTTLARGNLRIPYRVLGRVRALQLHDRLVARALPRLRDRIDVVHTWPLGARETLTAARRLGIPTVLERPNAHTRLAYDVTRDECARLGVSLPADHEHAYNAEILRIEEEEYELADALLCPSEFVADSFRERGFPDARLIRHSYGYDDARFTPGAVPRPGRAGITALFVGVCAVRKGLHFALDAWLRSSASAEGRFLIAGEFLPDYEALLRDQLAHPSVEPLGHRSDIPALLHQADVIVLPTIEEGFPLAVVEGVGGGCVPVVSSVCTDFCRHGRNALIHDVGDVDALSSHFSALDQDRSLLETLRAQAVADAPEVTWTAAGERLVSAYEQVVETRTRRRGLRAA